MESRSLVKAKSNLMYNNQSWLTKDKIYLALDCEVAYLSIEDDTGKICGYDPSYFNKLSFVDIWELKRNENI